jgi:hypothetical protein
MHNIIIGKKRCVIQTIQEETSTNIYFPTSFSQVFNEIPSLFETQNLVFITGDYLNVYRARDMLFQVSLHKVSPRLSQCAPLDYLIYQSKCIISRDVSLMPRKIDWLLTERLEDVKQIMNDNASFVQFPPLGSGTSLLSVFGENKTNIERTIRSLMMLVSHLTFPRSYCVIS